MLVVCRPLAGPCAIVRRAKTSTATGSKALAGIVDKPLQLKGWHKGGEYRASLRKDGKIRFRGKLWDSPSAASKAALRRSSNGWKFWHYKDRGEWVPLQYLRK